MAGRWWMGLAVVALGLVVIGTAASAGTLKISQTPGASTGSGGEFTIYDVTGGSFAAPTNTVWIDKNTNSTKDEWQVFCLEQGEDISNGGTYSWSIATYAENGGNGINGYDPTYTYDVDGVTNDPLSSASAWLYTQYWNGNLNVNNVEGAHTYNYDTVVSRSTSGGYLQHAFWYLEDELTTTFDNLDTPVQALVYAAQQVVVSGWTGLGNVRVLNLYDANGGVAQSQIIMIPLPPAVALGFGLLGLMAAGRGIRRRFNPS